MLDRSSRYIVTGYTITALGAVVNLINLWSGGALWSQSSRYDVGVMANLLATFAVLGGWWFLGQLRTDEERQRTIIRRGFFLFAVEQVLAAVQISVFAAGTHTVGFRYFVPQWAPALGSAVAALGFLIGAARLGPTGPDASFAAVDGGVAASE